MKTNDLLILGAVVAAVYFFRQSSPTLPSFTVCKYPDGTTISVPVGNPCPNDPTHGGQAFPCVSGSAGALNPVGPWAPC